MLLMIGAPVLCLLICLPLYMYYKKSHLRLAVLYKSTGTLCALIPALVAAVRLDPRCYICVAALVIYAVADYLLEYNIYIGAGFFIAGHVCYIAFFLQLFPVSAIHLVCLVCLFAVLAFVLYRNRKEIGKQMLPFSVYGGVLCVMTACAVGCMASFTLQGIFIAAGGALFFISDSILLHRALYPAGKSVSWVIMITYYAAQLLIGISCLKIGF